MSSKFSTPFMNKSPLKDAKFLTTLQPRVMNPEENINLTPEQLSEERDALADQAFGFGDYATERCWSYSKSCNYRRLS